MKNGQVGQRPSFLSPNGSRREIKQLEREILDYEWLYHQTGDLKAKEKYYELAVEHSWIYKRMTGHFPTRLYEPWMQQGNKMRGKING